jgi:hypothetical protein
MWANTLQTGLESKPIPESQGEAWQFYKRALSVGPLDSPCFKFAAYYAAQRADPEHASEAFQGSGFLERRALMTRGLGPRPLFVIFFVGVVLSALLLPTDFGESLALQALTLCWGLWCVYSNNLMYCTKCRNVWILLVGYVTLAGALYDHPSTWFIPGGVAALIVMWAALTKRLTLIFPRSQSAGKQDVLT